MTLARVLITGGAGFIGSNLSLVLLARGHEVTVIDNLSPQVHVSDRDSFTFGRIRDRVRFIKGDVTDRNAMSAALEGADRVVHLAAETGTGQSMYQIEHYMAVNVGGTALLLELLANRKVGVKKLVVASSRAIYGEGKYQCVKHGTQYPGARLQSDMAAGRFSCRCPQCGEDLVLVPTDEQSRLSPQSVYGISKQVQEQMFLLLGKSLEIPAIALRYQNVYGPGQSLSNPYTGILSIFSTRLLNGQGISIFEDGRESRDFVYIDDVVSATVAAVETESVDSAAINVGTGVATDVLTVANQLCEAYGKKVSVEVTGNFRAGDIRHNVADIQTATQLLGFVPKTDFATGIRRFADWVKSQEVPEDRYQQSLQEMRSRGLLK